MRILIVSQWFQPEGFLKGLPLAKALRDLGHEIEVLTGFPNYPQGRLYPGYRIGFLKREELDGVRVTRVPLYPSHDGNALRRIANYASFALSATLIGTFAVRKADVAYIYHPPATIGLPAMALRFLRNIPFVYDVQDLWPDSLWTTGMFHSRIGSMMMAALCQAVYALAGRVVVLSPGFKKRLCAGGLAEKKVEVIYNWCDDSAIQPVPRNEPLRRELGMAGRFVVMFAGNMGPGQHLDTVLTAAGHLVDAHPEVLVVFVGTGLDVKRLEARVRQEGLRNVKFIPQQPSERMGEMLALADVALVHLKQEELFRITIPSKIQAYMAAGRPVLAALCGDAAELVTTAGAGLTCPPDDPHALSDTIVRFMQIGEAERIAMGERGRNYYLQELSLSVGAQHLSRVLGEVASEHRARRKNRRHEEKP